MKRIVPLQMIVEICESKPLTAFASSSLFIRTTIGSMGREHCLTTKSMKPCKIGSIEI